MNYENLDQILNRALKQIDDLKNDAPMSDLIDIKNRYLAKKSELMSILATLGSLDPEQRKNVGQKVNDVKRQIVDAIDTKQKIIEKHALNQKLVNEKIDISLPGKNYISGYTNPFFIIKKF